MMNQKIILKLGNVFTNLEGDIPSVQFKELQKNMSFRPEGYQFSPMFNKWIYKDGVRVRRMWDGWKRLIHQTKKGVYFPTGLLSIALLFFKEHKIDYSVIDTRHKPESNINLTTSDLIKFYDYQKNEVIEPACKKGRGIIQSPTGSGKTLMSAGIIAKLSVAPFIFFVTSTDLLTQAKEEFEKFLLKDGKPIKVGQIGGGVIDIQEINVMTIQTAVRALGVKWDQKTKFDGDDDDDKKTNVAAYAEEIQELLKTAKGCICDEVQHWRADTCLLVCRSLTECYYTYGVSATPSRDQGDDLIIQSCFGKKIVEISASSLIRQGYLIKPSIKIVHLKHPASKFKGWHKIYKDTVVDNQQYNGLISNIANEYVENGRSVLVLVQQINHGKILESLIDGSLFVSGNDTKKVRQNAINDLRHKKIKCLISSTIFDEGIDVRALDTILLAGQGKSKTRAMQRIGRIMRLYIDPETGIKKLNATAIDFSFDNDKYLSKHATERKKMYKTEEEYEVEDVYVELNC